MSVTVTDRTVLGTCTYVVGCDRCDATHEIRDVPEQPEGESSDEVAEIVAAAADGWRFQPVYPASGVERLEEFLCPACPACEDSAHSWETVSTGTIIIETLTRCASCGYAPYPPERSWLPEFAALDTGGQARPDRQDGGTT